MIRKVKAYKAGFVESDSNISPDKTLADILALKAERGHSTIAVTEDGTQNGKLVGIVTSRDYRVSRMSPDEKISTFMTPFDKLITAPEGTTLKEPTTYYGNISSIHCPLLTMTEDWWHLYFERITNSTKRILLNCLIT